MIIFNVTLSDVKDYFSSGFSYFHPDAKTFIGLQEMKN